MHPASPWPPSIAALPLQQAWLESTLPWLTALALAALIATAVGIWMLVGRGRELERKLERLEVLERLEAALARLSSEREDLDLRRIEHALIEIRDGQRRVEDALLRTVQGAASRALTAAEAASAPHLAERVVNRLLALGYERVQLVTPREDLADEAGACDLEVLVEAHRGGVLCKGRVQVRKGALVEVDMKPAYSAFP